MTDKKSGFLSCRCATLESSGIHLREASPADLPLLAEIYATTRAEELQQVDWSAEQKKHSPTGSPHSRSNITRCTIRTPSGC